MEVSHLNKCFKLEQYTRNGVQNQFIDELKLSRFKFYNYTFLLLTFMVFIYKFHIFVVL